MFIADRTTACGGTSASQPANVSTCIINLIDTLRGQPKNVYYYATPTNVYVGGACYIASVYVCLTNKFGISRLSFSSSAPPPPPPFKSCFRFKILISGTFSIIGLIPRHLGRYIFVQVSSMYMCGLFHCYVLHRFSENNFQIGYVKKFESQVIKPLTITIF